MLRKREQLYAFLGISIVVDMYLFVTGFSIKDLSMGSDESEQKQAAPYVSVDEETSFVESITRNAADNNN